MSAFPFTVGDKVRLPEWITGEHVTITAVGRDNFLAVAALTGEEFRFPMCAGTWFRYGNVTEAAA